jgi:AraC-like DNA-binding protein
MEGPWEFIYVSCNGSELIRIARELLKRNGPEIKLSIDASPIQSLKKILGMAEKNLIKNPFTASSLAYSFIIELAELIFYKKENIDCIPQSINKAIDFMMKNFSRRISLKDIAVSAKMSKFHFSRVFKQYTGKTPVNYLKEIRMNHAVLLLQTQHLLIKETASECGFSDVSYFTKEFKKTFGTSPNKFRIRQ